MAAQFRSSRPASTGRLLLFSLLAALFPFSLTTHGKIQFDVFPGFDNTVRQSSWYPVGIEVYNDGPGFVGTIQLTGGHFGSQSSHYKLELPTGTRKRLVLPTFASGSSLVQLDARLVDEQGKTREERPNLRPNVVALESFLLGAMPSQFGGLPQFPKVEGRASDLLPKVVRILPEFVPDQSLPLESLNAIYLNSARALSLREPEIDALLAWLDTGGHLIVALDQPGDLNSAPWLNDLLPARASSLTTFESKGELHRWLTRSDLEFPGRGPLRFALQSPKNPVAQSIQSSSPGYSRLASDSAFDRSTLPLVKLTPSKGGVSFGPDKVPLLISHTHGRGLVTLLAFNPEREPFRSWRHLPWFWAKVCGIPDATLPLFDAGGGDNSSLFMAHGGQSLDSIFGAMIETRQIRKLPVGALIFLLVVYLAVIGPIDQWWLKKIRRPMLTWLTFPAYVAAFSFLIYYIGFRLRAGQTEYTELHVIDVLPKAANAQLRGRTFQSIYSPANDTYRVSTELPVAALRAEMLANWGGASQSDSRATIQLSPKGGYAADVYVPVWTSQMHVTEWFDSSPSPFRASATPSNDQRSWKVEVENRLDVPIAEGWIVVGGFLHPLPKLDPQQKISLQLSAAEGQPLRSWVGGFSDEFRRASGARGEMMGKAIHIDAWGPASVAASFPSLIDNIASASNSRQLVAPPAYDLTPLWERGESLLFAWIPDQALRPPMNKFSALRGKRATLLRQILSPTASNP